MSQPKGRTGFQSVSLEHPRPSQTTRKAGPPAELGWAGKKNGELIRLAHEAGFQVFVTVDLGIEYQQI